MISVEDVKDLIISVVAAMVDKVRMAEERTSGGIEENSRKFSSDTI